MSQNTPPFLKENDLIRFVGCSRALSEPDAVLEARRFLESFGFRVQIGQAVNARHYQWSGTDALRLSELQAALDCPDTRAICCVRGGHGMTRILPFLDWSAFAKFPKWIVGFSDITALLLAAMPYRASIHATMPALFGQDIESAKSLVSVLRGNSVDYHWDGLGVRFGTASGPVVAANLSMLCDSLGTAAQPDLSGAILILEEVGEYHYKIDRMFSQLFRAGLLGQLSALILGGFDNLPDHADDYGNTIAEIVCRYTKPNDVWPFVLGFCLGHQKPNLAIRLGESMQLIALENKAFRLFSTILTV